MQTFLILLSITAPTLLTLASPINIPTLANIDTSSHCGQWDTVTAGPYELLLDQWGISGGSGSQCAHITSLSGNTIAWTTNWTWSEGTGGVKTFTDIQTNTGIGQQLSAISSIPSTWTWSQSTPSGSIVADVAYDLFTSTSPTGSNTNEIMIWLANINAGPISSQYSSSGSPVPAKANISIAGYTWNLFSGSNGANNVFSFLPTSGTITNFNGDINLFLKYLTQNEGISTTQYLKTAQAGTEATSGTATLTTSAYSMVIN